MQIDSLMKLPLKEITFLALLALHFFFKIPLKSILDAKL